MTKTILYCIPYAGASAGFYVNFAKHVETDMEVVPLELAGKGSRFGESFFKSIEEAAADLYEKNIQETDGNYVLFGHSMGGLIALEFCYLLKKNGKPMPQKLILSAALPPHLERETKISNLPAEAFMNQLEQWGSDLEELRSDPDLQEIFLPIIRNDMDMVEAYQWKHEGKLETDILALYGTFDHITFPKGNEWAKYTNRDFTIREVNGNHMFVQSHMAEVVQAIEESLRSNG